MSKKIEKLSEQINYHRQQYYNKTAEISDGDFDLLIDELNKLDPKNKAITGIGAPVDEDDGWKKAKHNIPMGSLNKASNKEEVDIWIEKYIASTDNLFIVDKIDGLAIECLYEDGKFLSAISRGDGAIGDEIYDNVSKMIGVKQELPLLFTGSLRGEIILTKENHAKYFPENANVRNTAAGVSRRLDGVGCEYLSVMFYQAIGNVELSTEAEQMEYLEKDLGLFIPAYSVSQDNKIDPKEFVNNIYNVYQDKLRNNLDYEIDGLVVKINNLQEQQDAGERDSRPKGAIAYKFAVETAETIVKNIVVQTGNSGRLTPVVEVETVPLAGAMISRATLHNFKRVNDLGIDKGATVLIARRGEIIPSVENVVKPTGSIFATPTKCPACDGPVEMQGENLMCISSDICPAQVAGRISNWINNIGILEWGDKLISRLVESNKVKRISDLYKLTIDDLKTIDRMGDKSAKKCYDKLHSQSKLPLEIFIGSLSIPTAATSTIKMLIEAGYDTVDKLIEMSEEQLIGVRGIGSVKAKLIKNGLERNKKMINELLKSDIKIQEKVSGGLDGMKIAITGKTNIKRAELQKMISNAGGTYKSVVGKDCTHLVIADPTSTSVKAVSARGMGIKLIGENELMNLIGE